MSEYQYYEFLAIDRTLEQSEIAALRALSTRADITSTRFTNVYNYGDFKGSPEKLMEKYFDAHVYVANWGTRTLMLRLPPGSVDEETLAPYAVAHVSKFWTTKEHVILRWERSTEEPDDEWVEGEGWMARLVAIREELERGDYRSLYLGWLYGLQWSLPEDASDEDRDYEIEGAVKKDAIEPLVPAGLRSLTAAQRALVEFLGINQDLLAAAAWASPDAVASTDSAHGMERWVDRISIGEARPYLLLLLQGKARQAEAQIRRAYSTSLRSSSSRQAVETLERRSVAALHQLVGEARTERRAREEKKKQRELEKKRQERERYLTTLAGDVDRHWKQVVELAEQQTASAYDRARDLLVDLSEASSLTHERDDFIKRFNQFRATYGRRSALMRRLEKAEIVG